MVPPQRQHLEAAVPALMVGALAVQGVPAAVAMFPTATPAKAGLAIAGVAALALAAAAEAAPPMRAPTARALEATVAGSWGPKALMLVKVVLLASSTGLGTC